MAIRIVQKKGGLKTMKNNTEKKDNQINDVYLKTNDRLFTNELERLETIKLIRGFRKAERKRYEYLKNLNKR